MTYSPMARMIPRGCAIESVGTDVVTLDDERLEYHTMHERVFMVLQQCDGTKSMAEISMAVFGADDELSIAVTSRALLDLMDAGLLVNDDDARAGFLGRREVVRVAVGVVLGVVGLPLVTSITAPDSAAAMSRCGPWDYLQSCDKNPGNGCLSCCCCGADGAGSGICRPAQECAGLGGSCI